MLRIELRLAPGVYEIRALNFGKKSLNGCASYASGTVVLKGMSRHIFLPMATDIGLLDDSPTNAIAGRLDVGTWVDLVSLDGLFPGTTRLAGEIDGSAYYFERLYSGRYLLRLHVGRVIVPIPVDVTHGDVTIRNITQRDLAKSADEKGDDEIDRLFFFNLTPTGARVLNQAIDAAIASGCATQGTLSNFTLLVRDAPHYQTNVDFIQLGRLAALSRSESSTAIDVMVPRKGNARVVAGCNVKP